MKTKQNTLFFGTRNPQRNNRTNWSTTLVSLYSTHWEITQDMWCLCTILNYIGNRHVVLLIWSIHFSPERFWPFPFIMFMFSWPGNRDVVGKWRHVQWASALSNEYLYLQVYYNCLTVSVFVLEKQLFEFCIVLGKLLCVFCSAGQITLCIKWCWGSGRLMSRQIKREEEIEAMLNWLRVIEVNCFKFWHLKVREKEYFLVNGRKMLC